MYNPRCIEETVLVLKKNYKEICGDIGFSVFEQSVIPQAKLVYGDNASLMSSEVSKVITLAGDCRIGEIDSYLLGVRFKKSNGRLTRLAEKLEVALANHNIRVSKSKEDIVDYLNQ